MPGCTYSRHKTTATNKKPKCRSEKAHIAHMKGEKSGCTYSRTSKGKRKCRSKTAHVAHIRSKKSAALRTIARIRKSRSKRSKK